MLEAKTAYTNAAKAVNQANKYKTQLATEIADFRTSAKELQNLSVQFTDLIKDLESAGSQTIKIATDAEKGTLIKDGEKSITIKSGKEADAKALATKVATDIKRYFAAIATGGPDKLDIKNVAENAVKIYATLNTNLAKGDTDLLSEASQTQPTVSDLIKTVYTGVTGNGAQKEAADKNIEALKALQPKIMKALSDFVAAADALNQTFTNQKADAFTANLKITTDTATLSKDKALTDQAAKAKGIITSLGGVGGAELDKVIGTVLATAKGTEITNDLNNVKTQGVQGIDPAGYDATKLKNLLADNAITEEQKKQYEDLLVALNSLKEQLNKIAVTSSAADLANKTKSNVYKSLHEAGLTNFLANNLKITTDANGVFNDASIEQDIAEQIEKPIREVSNSLSNVIGGGFNAPAAALSMANQTNTMTRLAKLSTPYSKDLALASAIKNMDGLEVASGDNSALSSIIKEYTDRFNYDNSVYANVIGAKGYTDNGDPKLYGFSVGYDRSFDNFLVGSYFTYAKSSLDTSYLESEADNFELGIYSRAYLGDSEVDTTVSFGIGKNDINNYKLVNDYLNGDYDSKFINLAATYGYVVKAQNSLFIKPFIGLNYAYNKNDSFTLSNNAGVIQDFEKIDGSTLSANLGVELRKYLSDGSFMFITPSVEQELSVSRDDLVSKFRGASTSFTTQADETKDTYAKVIAGGEYAVTKDFSATVSAGFKTNGDDRYVNGSLGLKYKF
ncbi:autotransporter outer membrane beta-barrel domain-containing protein [Campylobacter hyointestinalis]|uniref:Autotransporter outer membrane beta-barrel domain-containing protein n=1 Tax=Campylobacter hyointestinalis TaxID=198 RepID=A0A562XDV8_CAMHY|nr:autotransporter outer membrane beta-barrel domain-containing protein [Campylobacter hyointestinalis]TWO19783.1 autotransporter outer membrane beta-barrel domain-containing protein [Campylobacter hyointestinalis]